MAMSIDDQKFMAAQGLVQWLAACVEQGRRLADIYENQFAALGDLNPDQTRRRLLVARSHVEGCFLANAANQLSQTHAR